MSPLTGEPWPPSGTERTLVEQAVTESRSFTEQEALGAAPPLIDLIANDVPDLV